MFNKKLKDNAQIGYKAFDKNLKCRDLQYIIGETYEIKGKISICNSGFHFCKRPEDVFNYYPKNEETRVCEVLAEGKSETEGDKTVSQSITIIKELTKEQIKNLLGGNAGWRNAGSYNAGSDNAGNGNAGSDNAGSYNAGNGNAGSYNAGSYNAGWRNAGSYNAGNGNAGWRNAGSYNAGNGNAGWRNAGSYNAGSDNAGNGNAGFFNIGSLNARLFDKDSGLAFNDPMLKTLSDLLKSKTKPILQWVFTASMTDKEKEEFPSHKTTGGCLRNLGRNDYSALNNEVDLTFFKSLPNFCPEVFFQITNIDVRKPKTIKVTVNGQEFNVDIDKAKELGLIKEAT